MPGGDLTIDTKLLGEFRVTIRGRFIPPGAWEHRRAAELVKLLGLTRGHRLQRDQAVETLWPHLTAEAGQAALHKAASQARSVLDEPKALVLRSGEVALAPEGRLTTDVATFEESARGALSGGSPPECAAAAALFSGELLPGDRYAEWTEPHRRRLQALHLDLLRKAGAWNDVIAADPTDESAHLALMRFYAKNGNRAAALRQFRRLKEILAKELGVSPSREAVELCQEIGRGPAVHAPVVHTMQIIGREVELARARALFRKVAEGRGATLLVRGDAGIGKTRFCEALLVEAASDGATTLRGEAREVERLTGYAPIVEAIERLLLVRPELAEQLTPSAREVIARLGIVSPGREREAPIGRQPVLSSVAQLLNVAAKERPVVLFIDDLHAADDSTIQLLQYVAGLARFDRIVIIGAYRRETGAALAGMRTSLLAQRTATEIDLVPMSRAESEAFLQRLRPSALSGRVLDEIWRRAEGNPLFTEILASSVNDVDSLEVPDALYDIVGARLARLDDALLRALSGAAVLGEVFSAEEFIAIGPAKEAEAFALLDAALDERIVDEVAGGYRFHHALVRESLVHALPLHRRRELHGKAAEALVSIDGAASRIAYHLLEADRTLQAVPWLAQAARDEAAVGAYANALELVERALQFGDEDVDLLALRAELLLTTSDARGPAAFDAAIRRARGARRENLRVCQAKAYFVVGDVKAAMDVMTRVKAPDGGPARVGYLVMRATLDWMTGQMDAAGDAAIEARQLATAIGDPALMTEAVLMDAMVAHSRAAWPEQLTRDLLDVDRAPALAAAVHEGHLCVAEGYLYGGERYEKIAAFAEELRARGERGGARRAVVFANCLLGETALLTGDLERAETILLEGAPKLRDRVDQRCLTCHTAFGRSRDLRGRSESGARSSE